MGAYPCARGGRTPRDSTGETVQTEFDFVLPRGYLDAAGQVHRQGRIRLATALDEIEAIHDPRVQSNTAYLPVVLLSRVVVALGAVPQVTPQIIGSLFAADLLYLEELYQRLNRSEPLVVSAICPHCQSHFQLQVAPVS